MWKYFLLVAVVLCVGVFYVYIKDPCNKQVETDFLAKNPSYEFLEASASEGSPESARCKVSYRKPDSEQIMEETWHYLRTKQGWVFGRVLPTAGK